MVKSLVFCAFLLVLASCNETPEPGEQDAVFDASAFEIDVFTGRVQDFLKSRDETKSLRNYKAVFVNTENCSACMKSAFESISPYLSATEERIFIYCNDSSILQTAPKNDNLQFVCLPAEVFQTAGIFHGKMYLYTIHNQKIEPLGLTVPEIDSLNQHN
jgi:hypothetical protein